MTAPRSDAGRPAAVRASLAATRRSCRRALIAGLVLVLGLGIGACKAGGRLRRGVDRTSPPPVGAPAAALQIPAVTERRLPSGLTLLVAEYHALPIIDFSLLLPGGASLDPPGKEGIAELTADLLRQGTQRRSAEELAREIEFLGGSLDADAGIDFATIAGEFLSKDLDQGLDLFADVVLHPAFRPEEFRRAQGLALAGIVAARENPNAIAERCFQSYLYGPHPYGHASDGRAETVRRLSPADARGFYDRHYAPDRAVLVIVGDAPADVLAAKAERAFSAWRPRGDAAAALPAATPVRGRNVLLVDKPDAKQTHIRVGNIAIARTDPEYVQAVVTSTILGGGFGSRLIEELRVKRSLTYGAWSAFAARRVPGDFRAATFTKVETTGEALGLTLDILRQYAASGATPAELERSQSLLVGQYPRQLETPSGLAGRLAELQAYGLPRSDLATYPARVTATSAEEVSRLAARYVPTDDVAIVIVGPAAALEPQLAPFAPLQRTTPEACDAPDGPRAAR